VGVDDDSARRGLPEHLGQAHAGGNDGGVAYHGHQIAMTARLRPQNAEAVLRVMEGDPLDEASEHFLCRRLRIRLHTD
jgi:hypothetical protein